MHNKALNERTIYNERTKLCHSYYAADSPGHTPKIVTALQVVGSPGHTQKIVTALGYWLSGPYSKNCHNARFLALRAKFKRLSQLSRDAGSAGRTQKIVTASMLLALRCHNQNKLTALQAAGSPGHTQKLSQL